MVRTLTFPFVPGRSCKSGATGVEQHYRGAGNGSAGEET